MKIKGYFPTFAKIFAYIGKHAVFEIFDLNVGYVFILAAYPVLFQYAKNWDYLGPLDLVQPLFWTLLLTYVFLALFNLAARDNVKSSFAVALFVIIFFSYGHIFEFVNKSDELFKKTSPTAGCLSWCRYFTVSAWRWCSRFAARGNTSQGI